MKVEIDQSGKVEYTQHDTVVALANGTKTSLLLPAKEKRILQRQFREIGKPRIYVVRVFSLLVTWLLRERKGWTKVVIDTEYPGWNNEIREYILGDLRKANIQVDPEQIDFGFVGKSADAHWQAYKVFTQKLKPTRIVTAKEVWGALLD